MARGPTSSLARLVLIAGRVACLIVLAWFITFAVNQTSSASAHQQAEVLSGPSGSNPAGAAQGSHEGSLHRTLNHTAEALTSPFSGAVSGSHSQWTTHIVETLLALLVYGVGIGFLVRFVRMRA